MKSAEQKQNFIHLRAEGKSYRAIQAETGISRSTCSEWEKELKTEIDRLRTETLEELYSSYGMAREARIRRLGDTLRRIDTALEEIDLSTLSPDKLLLLKLKYESALRDEYSAAPITEATGAAGDTLEAIQSLYRRTASGDTPPEKAKVELSVIDHMIDGYQRANPFDNFMM